MNIPTLLANRSVKWATLVGLGFGVPVSLAIYMVSPSVCRQEADSDPSFELMKTDPSYATTTASAVEAELPCETPVADERSVRTPTPVQPPALAEKPDIRLKHWIDTAIVESESNPFTTMMNLKGILEGTCPEGHDAYRAASVQQQFRCSLWVIYLDISLRNSSETDGDKTHMNEEAVYAYELTLKILEDKLDELDPAVVQRFLWQYCDLFNWAYDIYSDSDYTEKTWFRCVDAALTYCRWYERQASDIQRRYKHSVQYVLEYAMNDGQRFEELEVRLCGYERLANEFGKYMTVASIERWRDEAQRFDDTQEGDVSDNPHWELLLDAAVSRAELLPKSRSLRKLIAEVTERVDRN